jgi:hypothetical protein
MTLAVTKTLKLHLPINEEHSDEGIAHPFKKY